MTKREQIPFFTDIIGIVFLLAVTLLIPCLHPKQGLTLSIALGLMTALVATQIPGALNIDLTSS
ncbi:hypothetical protein HU723_25805 [Pseudomonas lurida]|jgi:uncharacterized membrane protein YeaQ/YmgE (transglycosylase-associated protein family)|uniref:hypothetical protein n=1 Tax=Pseudomonas TaxID=286 RepID=UPI0016472B2C|nr:MULTISPECIES: hypothetical protein [Pseudomonas]MBC3242606.1 hypothetical protein [Pseudomonas lurida]MBT1258943.1 hypothetical protein [Pseudomonas sp. VS40]MBT1271421.1 hypothetical protein [Pseudomonas sp. VS59]